MIIVVVEADLAVCDYLLVLRQSTEIVVPAGEDMFYFMWMDADGGIDERVLFRQCDRRPAGRQISTDGDEGFDAGFPGAGNHRLAVVIVAVIVQMGMGVDQHAAVS